MSAEWISNPVLLVVQLFANAAPPIPLPDETTTEGEEAETKETTKTTKKKCSSTQTNYFGYVAEAVSKQAREVRNIVVQNGPAATTTKSKVEEEEVDKADDKANVKVKVKNSEVLDSRNLTLSQEDAILRRR